MKNMVAIVATAAALAATPTFPQTFEVASVRKHQGFDVIHKGSLNGAGPIIRLEGYTVFGLILDAYNVTSSRIKVAPAAVGHVEDIYDTMYDVVARAPGDQRPALEDIRAMLRNLIAERFDLRTHVDATEKPVYALTVEKGAARLKAMSGATPCTEQAETSADGRNERRVFNNCNMDELADSLSGYLEDRPVVDATGLTGAFDFSLLIVPRWRARAGSDSADVPPVEAVRSLGLKLSERKAPLKMLSVDHLGKLKEN